MIIYYRNIEYKDGDIISFSYPNQNYGYGDPSQTPYHPEVIGVVRFGIYGDEKNNIGFYVEPLYLEEGKDYNTETLIDVVDKYNGKKI